MDSPSTHKLILEDFTSSPIQSEVPTNCPIRQGEFKENETLNEDNKDKTIKTIEDNKLEVESSSKIPVPSFRRIKHKNKDNLEVPQPKPRGDIPASNDVDQVPNGENKRNTVQDFDRLFQEINDKNRVTSMDLEILRDITPEDPEKVDGFFEEIIHAYEENKNKINQPAVQNLDNKNEINNNDLPKIQITLHSNISNEKDNSKALDCKIDTPSEIIKDFDEVLNTYSQPNHEIVDDKLLGVATLVHTKTIFENNKGDITNSDPVTLINKEQINVEQGVPTINISKSASALINDVVAMPIEIKAAEISEPIMPLNNQVITDVRTVEPVVILKNDVVVEPINVKVAELFVPLNNEVVLEPTSVKAAESIVSSNNQIIIEPINVEVTEPFVPLNNEVVLEPTSVETAEPIIPLNNEIILEPIIHVGNAEPFVPLNNEVVIEPISFETAEPIVPLNNEIVLEPMSGKAAEPIVSLNNDIVLEPINVKVAEPFVPLNNEVVLEPTSVEADEPIVPLNNEIILEPINVDVAEPFVPLNNEVVLKPISAKAVEPIVPLKNEIILEQINVEVAESFVPLNNEVVLEPISAKSAEPIVPLNNEIMIEPINVEVAEPFVPLNNEVVLEPISAKSAEHTVPLNNEIMIEPSNEEVAEPFVPLNNEVLLEPIIAKAVEPIVPLNNEIILKPINVEVAESFVSLNSEVVLEPTSDETAELIVPLNNEIILEPINVEVAEPIVPLSNEIVLEPINVEVAEPIVPLNNEIVLKPINVEVAEPFVPLNNEVVLEPISATAEPIVPLNNEIIFEPINVENAEPFVPLNNQLVLESISVETAEQIVPLNNEIIIEPINVEVADPTLNCTVVDKPVSENNDVPKIENTLYNSGEKVIVVEKFESNTQEGGITDLSATKTKEDKIIVVDLQISPSDMDIKPSIGDNNSVNIRPSFKQQNVESFEELKDEKPSRIPRRFNNNIKVYPTTDETYIQKETETYVKKITPPTNKIQNKTCKSFEEIKPAKYQTKSIEEIRYPNNTFSTKSKINYEKPEIIDVIEKSNSQDIINVENKDINKMRRFKSMPSIDDDRKTKFRKKTVAEIDLGDRVKGRVGSMVQRMTSIENSKHAPKELIHKVEVPRKQSVLDRVAMFEKKASVSKMDSPKDKYSRAPKPEVVPTEIKTEEMYKERIEELKNANAAYEKAPYMPVIELNNGQNMPVLAIGTALIEPILTKYVIEAAIDLGYRAIDTAFIYGNENLIGEAIKNKIDDGTVKREDLFIVNKLWSTFHKPDLVEKACRDSLDQMGLEYFDLYLIHSPMSFKEGKDVVPKIANVVQYSTSDYLDAWRSMETLVKKGLVKGIGVSNFNSQQLTRILEKGTVKPVVNQVESHPYLNQLRLNEFCSIRDIRLSCFATLGSKGTPKEYKCSDMAVVDDPLVKVLAAAIGKTPAQMLIRYQLEHERSVVVKTSSAKHLWENLQALTFKLTTEEIDALNALNKNKRYFGFIGMGDTHKNYPFTIPF